MTNTKKIKSIRVSQAGSAPDVDSDFATWCRDEVLVHCEDINGRGTVSNITTFGTLAARGAFKEMCKIYNVPFAQANKIAAMIPDLVEGVGVSLSELFDPKSARYEEGQDFRNAVNGSEWTHVVEGALAIEQRNKSVGMHPCGVIMSSEKLENVIPLQVRQSDQRVISQWTYPELEAMGLIKFDLLGLDTVDLIQHTVEYIIQNGKTPPNMTELVHGPMDDKKTFDLISKGHTIGVFQLASQGVQDLLRRMGASEFMDIVATTALFRPGPMGMNSHIKYADFKSGREKYEYPIHIEFKNSPLEKILADTQGLVVYQEQVILIASQIGGMTLQEGDDLRKAMGKKKIDVMKKMRPIFFDGGKKNGYSEDALTVLWNTIAEFARYGFNLSHSVAYSMNAYCSAYLKANYPVEFMSALIAQHSGKKDRVLEFLKEARRMGLSVGSANINASVERVAPDFNNVTDYDIVFGFGGINAVSSSTAQEIVAERNENGPFTSVQEMVNRCSARGVNNKKIYENLALAGAFDEFGVARRGIVENLPSLLGESKMVQAKGESLFDMFGGGDSQPSLDLTTEAEYPHLEKLQKESDVVGLYLTSHPLSNAGDLASVRGTSIERLLASKEISKNTIVGSLTNVDIKRKRRGGKSISVTLDDGTGYITAFLDQSIVKGLDKRLAQQKVRSLYESGSNEVPPELSEMIFNDDLAAVDELEKGAVYSVELTFKPEWSDNPYSARIASLTKVDLSDDGKLPIRVRLKKPTSPDAKRTQVANLKKIAQANPGDFPVFVAYFEGDDNRPKLPDTNAVFKDAVDLITAGEEVLVEKGNVGSDTETSLMGKQRRQKKRGDSEDRNYRNWPPAKQSRPDRVRRRRANSVKAAQDLAKAIESLDYKQTKLSMDKTQASMMALEKFVGFENFDFGAFEADSLIE